MTSSKTILFLLIVHFIYLSTEIFTLIFYIWMSAAIKIAFIIFFCSNIIYYICAALFILKIQKKLLFFIPLMCYILNYLIYLIILSVNISKLKKYWKYCPYLVTDLDYSLHFERRCELYNINENSRYSYQYICSYDSSKDFKKNNLKNEIKIDDIICISAKEIKENESNEVKTSFNNEYKNSNNYYCSRTNIPDNYSFVNHKNCKKAKYIWTIILYIIFIFEFIFSHFIFIYAFPKIFNVFGLRERMRRDRDINFPDFPAIPDNADINPENDEIQNTRNEENRNNIINRFRAMEIALNRVTENIRNLINNNINNNQLINDTKASENPYIDNSYIKQKTKNIIIENKQEYSIETNIKNIRAIKDNKIFNAINLDEIDIKIANSEKNELGNKS